MGDRNLKGFKSQWSIRTLVLMCYKVSWRWKFIEEQEKMNEEKEQTNKETRKNKEKKSRESEKEVVWFYFPIILTNYNHLSFIEVIGYWIIYKIDLNKIINSFNKNIKLLTIWLLFPLT